MINKNSLIVLIFGIILGFGGGYLFAGGTKMEAPKKQDDMHMDMNSGHDMSSMMNDMTAGLNGKTGPELEKEFLQEMIFHHEGAVDMAKILVKGTDKPELLKMGNDIINVQTKEIDMMKGWLNTWYK